MGSNLWQTLKTFNLFRILENEAMEMFIMGERSKSKYKLDEMKVCKGDEVIENFINSKIEMKLLASV